MTTLFFSVETDSAVVHDHINHLQNSPLLHSRTQELRLAEAKPSRRTPKVSCSEEVVSQCQDCNFQRARRRAMILSPLGSRLASWWCHRHCDSEVDIEAHRQSMATVMSVLSRRMLNLRRSISEPNLSDVSALFHHVDEETENLIRQTLDIAPNALSSETGSFDDTFSESLVVDIPDRPQSTGSFSQDLHITSIDARMYDHSESKNTTLTQEDLDQSALRLSSSGRVPKCIVTDMSPPTNRDSGYEESGLEEARTPSSPNTTHIK